MPHLTLEYSNNLPEPLDLGTLFGRLHATLAETGPFPLAQIKSRAVAHDVFRIGAGAPESIFAHLTVAIFAGRDLALQRRISERLLAILSDAFASVRASRPCDLTVEVREMRRETYGKAADTLPPPD